jgi:hypothetical protein
MPTIIQLYQNKEIRTWSYKVCTENGIKDTDDLISYYKQYESFMDFRNCGLLVNNELKEVCDYYSTVVDIDLDNPSQPIRYADVESGQKAIERGHIDLLVIVSHRFDSAEQKIRNFEGSIGWCSINK